MADKDDIKTSSVGPDLKTKKALERPSTKPMLAAVGVFGGLSVVGLAAATAYQLADMDSDDNEVVASEAHETETVTAMPETSTSLPSTTSSVADDSDKASESESASESNSEDAEPEAGLTGSESDENQANDPLDPAPQPGHDSGVYSGGNQSGVEGPAVAGSTHVIQWGETLATISRDAGVSVDRIVVTNNILDPNMIYAGSALEIPQREDM